MHGSATRSSCQMHPGILLARASWQADSNHTEPRCDPTPPLAIQVQHLHLESCARSQPHLKSAHERRRATPRVSVFLVFSPGRAAAELREQAHLIQPGVDVESLGQQRAVLSAEQGSVRHCKGHRALGRIASSHKLCEFDGIRHLRRTGPASNGGSLGA